MIAFVMEYLQLANELIGEDKPESILALQVVYDVHPSKDVVVKALKQLAEVVIVWRDLEDMLEELELL
jgi:phosphosulfolactate phosphohydrolase-like enzyme